jgi:prolycopene isomerase
MQNNYDVVIIGGGVSGLTLGAILAKAGQKCCIVEKESRPGGYLAGFQRKGFLFDTAIHWLNQFNEEGIAHRCFSFIYNP